MLTNRQRVLNVLLSNPNGITREDIAKKAKVPLTSVYAIISKMRVHEGKEIRLDGNMYLLSYPTDTAPRTLPVPFKNNEIISNVKSILTNTEVEVFERMDHDDQLRVKQMIQTEIFAKKSREAMFSSYIESEKIIGELAHA